MLDEDKTNCHPCVRELGKLGKKFRTKGFTKDQAHCLSGLSTIRSFERVKDSEENWSYNIQDTGQS